MKLWAQFPATLRPEWRCPSSLAQTELRPTVIPRMNDSLEIGSTYFVLLQLLNSDSGRCIHVDRSFRIYPAFRSAAPSTCAIFSVVSARMSDTFATASAWGDPASCSSLLAVSTKKRAAIIGEETSS